VLYKYEIYFVILAGETVPLETAWLNFKHALRMQSSFDSKVDNFCFTR